MSALNDEDFKIKLEANAVPLNDDYKIRKKLFRHAGKEAFIVGQKFKVTYTVTNIGNGYFPGGSLLIIIQWPEQPQLVNRYYIEPLEPNQDLNIPAERGVQAAGFNTFSAQLTKVLIENGDVIRTMEPFSLFKDEHNKIVPNVSFYSVFGQTAEEFYQLWGMIIAAASLSIIVFGDYILPFLKMIRKVLLLWLKDP